VSDPREAKERLKKQLDASLAVESVGSLIKCADLALLLASHDALEEALREVIEDYDWVQGGPGDRDWNVLDNTIIRARALLPEADQ
jgi:hypothetical protein